MKIVFMGTPDFAVGALEALIGAGHEIVAVVTQPDKPKGRSTILQPSPVKVCALHHEIPLLQPQKIKTPEAVAALRQYPADVFVVAAFGQILSQEILDMPPFGCLNIHASLLPKLRGASPIQHAILGGEAVTGVTIMQMNAGLDTGDMLYQKEVPIEDTDTFQTLHDKLQILGGEAIAQALPLLAEGALRPVPQEDACSTYAPLIAKDRGLLAFEKSAVELNRQIRAFNPWPSAYTFLGNKQLKIWQASPVPAFATEKIFLPGQVCALEKDAFYVQTKEGFLRVEEVQLEGKKRMAVKDFLLGVKIPLGTVLGE